MTDKSKTSDHSQLSSQGEVSERAALTNENIADIAPEYRGHGATSEAKADENKAWIAKDHPELPAVDPNAKPPPDTYAQEVNKNLGILARVKDKIEDGVEAVVGTVAGSTTDTKSSSGGS